jgi:hypothetical protein
VDRDPGKRSKDWQRWHDAYDDPHSHLSRRLAIVVARLAEAVAAAKPGPINLVSACAGQGRDVVGALAGHPRAGDVRGRLVELDPVNVQRARDGLEAVGLQGIEVLEADAGTTDAYAGAVPADVVLLCGVFGNVPVADIERTVRAADQLCAPGATVLWTRHRRAPDLTPPIRRWFAESGFDEVAFDAPEIDGFAVGTARLTRTPRPLQPGMRLFSFA